jgi:hypothetical protein
MKSESLASLFIFYFFTFLYFAKLMKKSPQKQKAEDFSSSAFIDLR